MSRAGVAIGVAGLWLAALHAGCKDSSPDLLIVQFDAGAEDADAAPAAPEDAAPALDPTIGGPCSEDVQCDDQIPCTFDRCDLTIARCRNTPDDSQCSDGKFCNGEEVCKVRQGCMAGPVESCEDGDGCTIDRCIEATKQCEHVVRDADGDGNPDDHCTPHADCDDTDPTINSKNTEICGNFKDDNCNGQVDETPCTSAPNDVCATAALVTAPGTLLLSTVAASFDYPTSCSVASPLAAKDLVVAIEVPPGNPKDVIVRADGNVPPTEVSVAIQTTCGSAVSEIACGHVALAPSARTIARNVAPGTKIYAIVTTQRETAVDVKIDMPDASPKPTNETCSTAKVMPTNVPFIVSLIDPAKDIPSGCDEDAKTGELTYSFTIIVPKDVRIFASAASGYGQPVVSLRGGVDCADELSCHVGDTPPIFARNLQPGTYVYTVSGTGQLDASILVETSDPTTAPADQSCDTAPVLVPNTTLTTSLVDHTDAIKDGCAAGAPNAAYKLTLDQSSDVLLVGRVGSVDTGGIALAKPTCTVADTFGCGEASGGTPFRWSQRNVAPGDYRVIVADDKAQDVEVLPLVRPTVSPTTVTADTCADPPAVIPETGGYFVGDTTNATANFNAGCDALGQPEGGAKDMILRLVLTAQRRVIMDMVGSGLFGILDLRQGDACPGMEVPDSCFIGATQRPYVDKTLDPGTYWVQIDGYNGAVGRWALDVRVLPP